MVTTNKAQKCTYVGRGYDLPPYGSKGTAIKDQGLFKSLYSYLFIPDNKAHYPSSDSDFEGYMVENSDLRFEP